MKVLVPIRAASRLTGLSVDTLRAWERRYRAVVPKRTARGRQYDPAQIDRLRLLSQAVQSGHAIGGIAALSDRELNHLLKRHFKEPAAPPLSPIRAPGLLDPILTAVEDFNAFQAAEHLSRLAAILTPRDVIYRVALPLISEVGARWSTGKLAIAQEHLVSQLLRSLLGSMLRLFRSTDPVIKMVLATPGGEMHEFGVLAAAMFASMAGIQPVYLGVNLPAPEIVQAVERTGAQVVVLGLTLNSATVTEDVKLIAATIPASTELWLGGPGAGDLNPSKLGGNTLVVRDLPGFEAECRRWKS